MSWKKFSPNIIGKVICHFNGTDSHCLKLSLGDTVIIKSQNEDWYYGYCILNSTQNSTLGIFPRAYVKEIGKEESSYQDTIKSSDCSLDLLKSRTLNAIVFQTSIWVSQLNASLLKENNMENYEEAVSHINELIELFYEIANWSINKESLIKFQNKLLVLINKINSFLNSDVTIRTKNLSILNVVNFPLTSIEQYHLEEHISSNPKLHSNISNNNGCMTKLDPKLSNNLQVVIDNFEFFGCSDEIILQLCIVDILTEWHFEPFWLPIKEVKKGRPVWMGTKFIFKNIPGEIKKDSVYLVVYVYRIGQLLTDPNKQLNEKFRRPIAFGSYSLKEISSEVDKTTIPLCNLNEMDFLKSTNEILRMRLPAPVQTRFVAISTFILNSSHQDFKNYDENHIVESVFLKSDKAYESNRHCLYLHLDNAEFDKANKTSARNIEAQISIKNLSGEKQACIGLNPSTTNQTDYYTSVTYHCNSPKWKDLIKINLNAIKPSECNVTIDFYHCTTKDKKGEERKHFGSCFVRLVEFLDCGSSTKSFSLSILKVSNTIKHDSRKYAHSSSVVSLENEKIVLKEYCNVSLILCSTHLSNNREINDFIDNRLDGHLTILQIRQYLKDIQKLNNEDFLKPKLRKDITELVKTYFLSKLYVTNETIQIELFITWQILSHKFFKFGMMDELLNHLRGKFEFINGLLSGIQYILRDDRSLEISFETIAIVIESIEPIFMILSTYSDSEHRSQISQRIKDILKNNLLFFNRYNHSDENTDIRKVIFKYTITTVRYLQSLISIGVLREHFKNLFKSQDFLDENILPNEKLDFIFKLLNLNIHLQCTEILFIWFNPLIQICTKLIDNTSLYILQATQILLVLFDQIKLLSQEERIGLFDQQKMKSFFTRLFFVFNSMHFKSQQKKKIQRQESINPNSKGKLLISPKNDETDVSMECLRMYSLLFSYLEEWHQIENSNIDEMDIYVVLVNIKILLDIPIYPKRWLSMHLKISNISDCILNKAAEYLQNNNEDAHNKLIPVFFDACYTFLTLSCLQLQDFPLAKSHKIMDEYGDMRINVMECFHRVWTIKPSKVDTFDKAFTIQTTMNILKLSFLPVHGIRRRTIPLLIHIIRNWVDKCDNIIEVLRDLILEIELFLREGRGDDAYSESLNIVIQYGNMEEDVLAVVESFRNLLNLHLEYRKIKNPMSSVLQSQFLLHEFKKYYQEEVSIFSHFQHYSDKLSQMLEAGEHYLEAALTLQEQHDCFQWTSDENSVDTIFFENFEGLGNEAQKAQLSKKILDLLSETKEYEYAVDWCKRLYKSYLKCYKYKELSPLMIQWAKYYELIMTEPRLMLNYYRVTFIGGTLPLYMKKHKDYVVKGSMWFKINSLKSLLTEAFPDAEIQFYQSTPPSEPVYEQKMIIYLAKIEPVPLDIDFITTQDISTKIRNYYKDHRIVTFTSDHPYHKGTVDKENEIKTLHLSRVTVMTEEMMPNMFMWNPIVRETRECLTPIEVAIDAVQKKNQIFKDVIDEYTETPSKDLRPFTMLLTGTLDAGVNGGMAKYIEAFFNEKPNDETRISSNHINNFRDVLIDQKNVLLQALTIHRKLSPPQIQPMQERLEECFAILNKTVMDLNVPRKRSFSNMQSLNDVYMSTSEISFEIPNIEQDYSFLRQSSRVSEQQIYYLGENNRYSDGTNSSSNTYSPQSHSGSEKNILGNGIETISSIKNRISSTDDDTLTRFAIEYLRSSSDRSIQSAIPTGSSPDIKSKFNSNAEDSKSLPLLSPPLPPNNDERTIPTAKTKSKYNWIKKTLRSRSRDVTISNHEGNPKLSGHRKSKPKLAVMDIFKSTDLG